MKAIRPQDYHCEHRHSGDDHTACYIRYLEQLGSMHVGYLDIETSQLNAQFGIMYSWAIKVKDGGVIYDCVRKEDFKHGINDKRITASLIKAMNEFDIIYTYYGSRFDVPFARTRAMKHNLTFTLNKQVYHNDLYYAVRSHMKLPSNRLKNVTKFLGIEGKTDLDAQLWVDAMYGNKKALGYILEHNIADVEILEKVHKRIIPYINITMSSV